LCIALYVLALALDIRAVFQLSGGPFSILSPSGAALRWLGSTAPIDLIAGRPWTVLTAIYLHGGLLHILFNMMWVRDLGPEVQRAFGTARFFVIWTASGALGFLFSDGLPLFGIGSVHASIGASGSIFGLMAALIVYGRTIGASLLTRQLWTWAILMGAMGFLLAGVDNVAHIGGFAGGWATATLYKSRLGRPDGPASTFLALGLLALTTLSFVLAGAIALLRLAA
jgi:rhomboid protease GluP